MDSIYLFFMLLLLDWVLGFLAGWWSRKAWSRRGTVGQVGPGRTSGGPDHQLDQLRWLHEDVRQELSLHATSLAEFEQFLQSLLAGSDKPLAQSWGQQVQQVRTANRRVVEVLQRASSQLRYYVRLCSEQSARQQRHAEDFQARVRQLSEILSAMDDDTPAEARIRGLTALVRELTQENVQLRQELEQVQSELSQQAAAADAAMESVLLDVLTQLPNRRAFEEKVSQLQASFQRGGRGYVVGFLDVDGFRQINDQHGQAVGDAALAMLGQLFREIRRNGQHVFRFDGDRFALLLPGDDLQQARAVAEIYRQKVESACLRFADRQVRATASIGMARTLEGEPPRGAIVRADAALVAAKTAGGNQVRVHEQIDGNR